MNYNRRKFIYLSALGTAGLLFPTTLLGETIFKNNDVLPSVSNAALQNALLKAKEANTLRLAKSLAQAEAKYREAIALMPTDIRFYDGLRKVLVLQKDKVQSMVELYQSGYAANPNNAAFVARLADMYCQLEMGNKAIANAIKEKTGLASLSDEAQKLYAKAISLNTRNKIYPVSQVKLGKLKQNNAFVKDARKNEAMHGFKKGNRAAYLTKVKAYTPEQLNQHLLKSTTKNRRVLSAAEETLRQKDISRNRRSLYLAKLKKYKELKDAPNTLLTAKELYSKFPNDKNTLQIIKKAYRTNKQYPEITTIAKERYASNPTIWSGIGVMKAIQEQYVKSGTGNLSEAIAIGSMLLTKAEGNLIYKINILSMMSRHYTSLQEYSSGLQKLDEVKTLLMTNGIAQATIVNQYFSDYGLTLAKSGDATNAEKVLKIGLGRITHEAEELVKLFRQKNTEQPSQRRDMEIALAKVYLQSNSGKATEQLQHILSLYPNEKFALKKL